MGERKGEGGGRARPFGMRLVPSLPLVLHLSGLVETNLSLRWCQNEPRRCGLFVKFEVLDFQRGGLIGYGIKLSLS